MTVKSTVVVIACSVLFAGCAASSPPSQPSEPVSPSPAVSAPITQPAVAAVIGREEEPLSPEFARPAAATDAHLQEIGPAVLELARRAEEGDRAYFFPRMGQPGDHMVQSMIEKVRASDLPNTYRAHLIGDRLNYHDKTHVQIELAQKDGKWEVSKLWFCR